MESIASHVVGGYPLDFVIMFVALTLLAAASCFTRIRVIVRQVLLEGDIPMR